MLVVNEKEEKKTLIYNFVFFILMLYFTNFIGLKVYQGVPRSIVAPICYLCLVFFLFGKSNYLRGHYFSGLLKFTLLSFFLSCIPTIIIFKQDLYSAIAGLPMYIFPVLLYFMLCKWNINEKIVYKYLIVFTFVFCFIEIFQQFTYPVYWFAGREESILTGQLEQRMGYWRFYLFGISYCLLAMMLCFEKILYKESFRKNIIYLFVCALAVYFFLSRKDIYASLLCIFIGTVLSRSREYLWLKFLFFIFLIVSYYFLSSSMVDLNEQTISETGENSEDFIRFIAADYFINRMSDSPLYYLFGSGIPGTANSFQKFMSDLSEYDKIYQDDCGFVGYFSKFGLFGLLIQILIIGKVFINYKHISIGLILFALLQLIVSFFDFWGNNSRNLAAWSIFLYLVDKSIQKNKLKA